MKVVILDAGMSSRLRPLTDEIHKCMLKVNEKSIIEHQLDIITHFKEVDEVVIVVGYRKEMIMELIGDSYKGVKVSYVENEFYEQRNISYSFYLTKDYVKGSDFIYIEGDTLFDGRIFSKLINSKKENCLMVDKNSKSKYVDTIILGEQGVVQKLIFTEHGDLNSEIPKMPNCVGELLLLLKFNSKLGEKLFEEIEKIGFNVSSKHLYYVFDCIFSEELVSYEAIENIPWVEIDNFEDLEKAKTIF